MTPEKPKAQTVKKQPVPAPAPGKASAAPAAPAAIPKPPPLFRPIDWLTFGLVTVLLLVAYSLTRAPNMTLQDSGEECVASMYMGVPHPPGYPIWTLVTWLFTKLIPYSNIAWRVSWVSSLAAAFACGMIALMVSRGSSMFLESIEQFKSIDRSIEKGICLVSGFVAGLLIGFNGFLWSQATIVEVYPLSTLSLTGVMICLMRWIYAPHQHRYLYLSWFLYGVCFNNHQSLLVIAISMEIVVALAQPRLGRALFLGNFLVFSAGLLGKSTGAVTTLSDNVPVLVIFSLIGVGSFAGWAALWMIHATSKKQLGQEIWFLPSGLFFLLDAWLRAQAPDSGLPMAIHVLVLLGCLSGYLVMSVRQKEHAFNWALVCFVAFLAGASFYLLMPIASAANPPMNWGYPRTVTGFFHALTRGQYERIHPTFQTLNVSNLVTYLKQLRYITGEGALEEFNLIYLLVAFVPFFFVRRLMARERCWLIGVAAFYLVLGPAFLLILLNPAADRQSVSLNKVFFTPSHSMIAMFVGYGLTFLLALLVTQYERYRRVGAGGVCRDLRLCAL